MWSHLFFELWYRVPLLLLFICTRHVFFMSTTEVNLHTPAWMLIIPQLASLDGWGCTGKGLNYSRKTPFYAALVPHQSKWTRNSISSPFPGAPSSRPTRKKANMEPLPVSSRECELSLSSKAVRPTISKLARKSLTVNQKVVAHFSAVWPRPSLTSWSHSSHSVSSALISEAQWLLQSLLSMLHFGVASWAKGEWKQKKQIFSDCRARLPEFKSQLGLWLTWCFNLLIWKMGIILVLIS